MTACEEWGCIQPATHHAVIGAEAINACAGHCPCTTTPDVALTDHHLLKGNTMTSNPWDEFSAGGDFVEFNGVGDTFAGTIRNIGVKTWDDGKKSPQLTMTPDGGGEDQVLTASWVMLVSALKREAPMVGDHLRVTLTGIGPKPKETREWKVEVTRAAGGPTSAPSAPTSTSPAAAPGTPAPEAAAPAPGTEEDPRLAGFTDEQKRDPKIRAALGLPPIAEEANALDAHPATPALRASGKSDEEIRALLGI